LSTAWSFFSLLKGQLFYIEAIKANFVPLFGKIDLLLYFAIGLSGRLFSVVLFFTPLLGLFDTSYHWYLGSITVFESRDYTGSIGYTLFDYIGNNTPIYFYDTWEFYIYIYDNASFFCPTELYVVIIIFFVILIFHTIIGHAFQTKLHGQSKEIVSKKIFEAVYALLCPPLILDWEEIYRKSKGLTTHKKSWRKSQKLLIFHIIIEHIILCVPLMILKSTIGDRNEQLKESFPPLNDELHSTYIVNVLIGSGIAVAVSIPPIQYGLFHLYLTKGHPWSRIHNAKLCSEGRQ
jgi:hypothetical protein